MTDPATARPTVDDALLDRLGAFPTPLLSDALDDLGVCGAMPGLQPVDRRQGRIAGRAFTAQFVRKDSRPDQVRAGGGVGGPLEQVLREMGAGDVVVMDLGGTLTASAWGGLASQIARAKGVKGTVLFGTCRDVLEILEHRYPLWSVGVHPRRSRNEFALGGLRQELRIGPVRVWPGDAVVADDSGVVCVPAELAEKTAERCAAITASEDRAAAAIRSDLSTLDWDKV